MPATCVRVCGALVLGALSSACVDIVATDGSRYIDRVERSFTVTGRPDVAVSTFDGSIEIRSWDRAEVHAIIEKRAEDKAAAERIEVRVEQAENRITIDVLPPPADGTFAFDWTWHRSARLIVSLPSEADVRAKSGDGSIDIAGVVGRINVESGDGRVLGRDLSGDLQVHTGDGSIDLSDVSGQLDVSTGDGSIAIAGRLAALDARSGDGRVAVRAEAGSGRTGDWDIVTGDGSVTLEVADDFGGELDARTGDGRIVARNVNLERPDRVRSKERREVRGRIGAGGRQVRVRTGDGSITIRRLERTGYQRTP